MTKAIPMRDMRQTITTQWARKAFGDNSIVSVPQRGLRLLEEAIECAQACGVPIDKAQALLEFVYHRPVGVIAQEIGGIGVTMLVLATACGLSADEEEAREVARVLAKDPAEFAARNAAKNAAGFDLTKNGD